jgi:hypothetical protein
MVKDAAGTLGRLMLTAGILDQSVVAYVAPRMTVQLNELDEDQSSLLLTRKYEKIS